jgi:hypothetical protein
MSSTSNLSGFAARLRESILMASWGADFEDLALQLFALQFEHNPAYRRLCEARGTRPDSVTSWTEVPAVPTSAFKELALTCLPAADRTAVFHSSGTTEQRPSRHFHNACSLSLYEASLLHWFEAQFPSPMAHGRLAILTPPPAQAPHSSLVHMFETIRRKLASTGSLYIGRVEEEGAWALETEAAVEVLRQASHTGQRMLMLGTAFSFVHLLDYLAEHDLRFALPAGSRALETGGYKGRSRSLPKRELHGLISQRLGIPLDHIVCEYGMSELSSQAYDSAIAPSPHTEHATRNTQHATRPFRFPPWARVQIISPETGCEVAEGETGLIRVFDLANVYSVLAVQTEDLGVRCGAGFTLEGRAVAAEPRGCSLMAV